MVWYGMVWYGLNGAGRRPTHHLGSGRGQSPPGGPFLLPSGGPQIWGQSPRPARPALPLGTVAGSEFTGSPPPPTRTPSRKGALDSRPTGPSPRLPRGGSEGCPAICQFICGYYHCDLSRCAVGAAPLALGHCPWGARQVMSGTLSCRSPLGVSLTPGVCLRELPSAHADSIR